MTPPAADPTAADRCQVPGPVVDVEWLCAHHRDPDLLILDGTSSPLAPATAMIPGAVDAQLDGLLSDHSSPWPHQRHTAQAQREALGALGVSPGRPVVVYDAVGLFTAARVWWLLRGLGHDNVAVLNGGLPAWQAAGHDTTEAYTEPVAADAVPTGAQWADVFVDEPEVLSALADDTVVILDARSPGRFAGTEPEPRPGLRTGHIPGAHNLPVAAVQDNGVLKDAAALQEIFSDTVGEAESLIVSCGSGVSACVLALAAEVAGLETPVRVYDGSWAQWGRADGPAIER